MEKDKLSWYLLLRL